MSGSKLLDTLMIFQREFFLKKLILNKSANDKIACKTKELNLPPSAISMTPSTSFTLMFTISVHGPVTTTSTRSATNLQILNNT